MFIAIAGRYIEFARNSAAWMVFFAWIDLILYLEKFDGTGGIIRMTINVAKVIVFGLLTYSPMFISFSLVFYIQHT